MGGNAGGASEDERSQVLCWMARFLAFRCAACVTFAVYALVPLFRNETESLWCLREQSLLCLAYKSSMQFGDDDRNTQ